MSKQLRILYAAGPGDVIGTYKYWIKAQDDPSQVAITYSSQFYNACRNLDAKAYVISLWEKKKFLRDGQFILEHRPNPLSRASGLLYHVGQVWYGLRLVATAIAWRADVAVVAEGTTHWFVLSLLTWLGVKAIPTIHCTLWCKFLPQRRVEKLILGLNRNFFAKDCTAILGIGNEVAKQVAQLTSGQHQPIVEFIPTYSTKEFVGVGEPDEKRSPFRVLFAGRIERNKGVFDLLQIAKRFQEMGREDITFDICGTGSALESWRQEAKLAGVESFFTYHGYYNKPKMQEMYKTCHVVIVPTRTDFVEGFNKVLAEGVLAGRPVVTSAVCPGISYVGDAIVEVPPNDTKAYGDALLELCDNRQFYEQKRQNCLAWQAQFYDSSYSWGAAFRSVIMTINQENNLKAKLDFL
ncbi:glycosyltransferase family 4 protein [Microseira wollei]|uniref:Glycosyl transferase group 1 n=1 Tax=Microseira wollei NIES-4236 TaxID=2530354 RepID=A0AAV3XGR5_9CYAN|nr:glycosyltransferase family 4 protein [Microseira wollei]GET41463.1 glycosyl transferase group 1 [Microseira wollei NIES-4236]